MGAGAPGLRRLPEPTPKPPSASAPPAPLAVTVHFIGAGPGDPELITVRGRRLIEGCPVVLYAGSLVPREVVACAPEGARVRDTASMTLDEIVDEIRAADAAGKDIARVHSGDPSLYGAVGEQMRRLDALGIPYDVTPGVPAYAAAAAALERELTLPGVSQTVILTRTSTRSSPMPEGEALEALARSGYVDVDAQAAGETEEESYFRTTPWFETGDPRYEWMTRSIFVGSGRRTGPGVEISFYEVL